MPFCACCSKSSPAYSIAYYNEVKNVTSHPQVLLIDVRERHEIEELGKIPTSINIPLRMVEKQLGDDTDACAFKCCHSRDKPTKETPIIFYCRSGKRAAAAAECAAGLGYKNVKSYEGSWNDWAQYEGLPH